MLRPLALWFVSLCALLINGCAKKDVVTKENFQQVSSRLTSGLDLAEVEKILGPGKALDKNNMPTWVLPDLFLKTYGSQAKPIKEIPPDAMKDFPGDFYLWGDQHRYIMMTFQDKRASLLWQKGIPGEL